MLDAEALFRDSVVGYEEYEEHFHNGKFDAPYSSIQKYSKYSYIDTKLLGDLLKEEFEIFRDPIDENYFSSKMTF